MKKVTCIVGDRDKGKIIVEENGKSMVIPAVIFSEEQSKRLLDTVDKVYSTPASKTIGNTSNNCG